jgi:hypothetical protein
MLAEECGQIAAGMTVRLFGSQTNLEDRFSSEPGILSFTDATLGTAMESWAKTEEGKGLAADFYSQIASTAIDSNGLADEKTLRVSEVTIPLTLTSPSALTLRIPAGMPILQTSAPLLREIGSHMPPRLGRVSISVRGCSHDVYYHSELPASGASFIDRAANSGGHKTRPYIPGSALSAPAPRVSTATCLADDAFTVFHSASPLHERISCGFFRRGQQRGRGRDGSHAFFVHRRSVEHAPALNFIRFTQMSSRK